MQAVTWLKWIAGAAVLFGAALVAVFMWRTAAGGLDPTNPATTLSDVESTVSRRYPVAEIAVTDLEAALPDPSTVVFDVREATEYAQSRIPGAVRIDPGLSAEAFLARHGKDVAGKRVVFYCAVGVRSGIMAQRTEQIATQSGAAGVYNLRGGIFRWHATGGALLSDGGPAATVHPYDASWRQLLERTLQSASKPRL